MEQQYKILILEPEQDTLTYYRDFFLSKGFLVDTAQDGLEGVKKLCSKEFEVALVSFNLPKFNGLAVSQYINKQRLKTAVVILSHPDEGHREDFILAINTGVSGWFEKSGEIMSEVLIKVEELVEARSLDDIDRFLAILPKHS